MTLTNEIMAFTLGADVGGFTRGLSAAHGELQKFSAGVAEQLTQIAATTNTSMSEVVETSEKLAEVLGTSLSAATALLADAMKDPVNGITALTEAGLRFSAAQQEEVAALIRSGQEFDAYDAIINRVSDSHRKLSDATSLAGASFDTIINEKLTDELNEQLRIKNDIAEIDRQLASSYEYEAKLLDDLNYKWAEQEAMKKRSAEYANIPTGYYSSIMSRTGSEDAAMAAGGGFEIPASLAGQIPGGAAMAAGGLAAAGAAAGYAVGEFAAAEAEAVRLESVLQATGNACGFTAEQLRQMSGDLQDTTTYTGNQIAEAQIFLASLKEIKGDTYRDVLTAAADLAVVMGTDLRSATEALGRALIDPEQGMQSLRRAGIFLTEAQNEQIKSLIELNRLGEAQKIILDEVASRTEGAATDAAKTLSGSWQNLRNDIGNLAESIGSVLGPPLKWLVQGMNGIVLVAQKAADGIGWIVDKVANFRDTITEVRIAWNELWNDVEEAESLRAAMSGGEDGTASTPTPGSVVDPAVAAETAARNAKGKKSGSGGGYGGGGGGGSPASFSPRESQRSDAFAGVDERFGRAAYDANLSAEFLRDLSPEQSGKFVSGMRDEIGRAASGGGLRIGMSGRVDTAGFEKIMATYRASAEKMQGFDAAQWEAMQQRAVGSLRMATMTSGRMREMHLQNLADALSAAEKMFEDYGKKLEDAKKVAAEQRVDAAASPGAIAGQAARDDRTSAGDYYATLQNASKRDINRMAADYAASNTASVNSMSAAGIGTPEQRRGVAELGRQFHDMLKQVGNSTGEAREANVAELKKMEEAFAKAFEAIRNGSKETADKLIADAKRQGEEALKAGGKSRSSANDPLNEVGAMSRALSGAMTGSFGGRNIGAGQAGLAGLAAGSSPMRRLELAIQAKQAEIGMASINAQTGYGGFGGRAAGLESLAGLQRELASLQKRRQDYLRDEAEQRTQAESRQQEGFRRQQVQKAESDRQRAKDAAAEVVAVVGGGGQVTMNLYGVTDTREMVDKLDRELKRRGRSMDPRTRMGK